MRRSWRRRGGDGALAQIDRLRHLAVVVVEPGERHHRFIVVGPLAQHVLQRALRAGFVVEVLGEQLGVLARRRGTTLAADQRLRQIGEQARELIVVAVRAIHRGERGAAERIAWIELGGAAQRVFSLDEVAAHERDDAARAVQRGGGARVELAVGPLRVCLGERVVVAGFGAILIARDAAQDPHDVIALGAEPRRVFGGAAPELERACRGPDALGEQRGPAQSLARGQALDTRRRRVGEVDEIEPARRQRARVDRDQPLHELVDHSPRRLRRGVRRAFDRIAAQRRELERAPYVCRGDLGRVGIEQVVMREQRGGGVVGCVRDRRCGEVRDASRGERMRCDWIDRELAVELGRVAELTVAYELGRDRVPRRIKLDRSAVQVSDEIGAAIEQLEPALIAGARRGIARDVEHAQPAGAAHRATRFAGGRVVGTGDCFPAHHERAGCVVRAIEHERGGGGDLFGRRARIERRLAKLGDALPRVCRSRPSVCEHADLDRVCTPRRRDLTGEHAVDDRCGELRPIVTEQPRFGDLDRDRGRRLRERRARRLGGGIAELGLRLCVCSRVGKRRDRAQPRRERMLLGELEVPHRFVRLMQAVGGGEGDAHVEVGQPAVGIVGAQQRGRFARDELEHALDQLTGIGHDEAARIFFERVDARFARVIVARVIVAGVIAAGVIACRAGRSQLGRRRLRRDRRCDPRNAGNRRRLWRGRASDRWRIRHEARSYRVSNGSASTGPTGMTSGSRRRRAATSTRSREVTAGYVDLPFDAPPTTPLRFATWVARHARFASAATR